MKSQTPRAEIEQLTQKLLNWNVKPQKITGKYKITIGLIGDTAQIAPRQIQAISPFIEKINRIDRH